MRSRPPRSARSVLRLVVLLTAVAGAVCTAQADAVDDLIGAQMAAKHIPGVALAVLKDGKTIKVRGYGVANLEHGIEVTPDTVFRVGSVSKQFLASAVMLLVNDGKLSLDDRANRYLESTPAAWNDITIRHLLSHTSGLVREGPAFDRLKVQPDADVIKSAYAVPLVFNPGEQWQYSNLGYFVLAEIITRVAGKPWHEVVRERIFKPAGMHATGIANAETIVPHRAEGYDYDGRYRHAATLLAVRPSGAFMSTLNDLVKWHAALDKAELLPHPTLDAMWTPIALNSGGSYPYGLGWQLNRYGSHQVVWHGGSTPGFRAEFMRIPDSGLSIVLLANSDTAPIDSLALLIAERYVDDLFPRRAATTLRADQLHALAGAYRFNSGNVNTLAVEGPGLRFKSPVLNTDMVLLPASATEFFSVDDPRITFVFGIGVDIDIDIGNATQPQAVSVTSYSNGAVSGAGTRAP
jgi:D-alanyl-D-alanine carboxypeptidase